LYMIFPIQIGHRTKENNLFHSIRNDMRE